jgi:hypothetical protein
MTILCFIGFNWHPAEGADCFFDDGHTWTSCWVKYMGAALGEPQNTAKSKGQGPWLGWGHFKSFKKIKKASIRAHPCPIHNRDPPPPLPNPTHLRRDVYFSDIGKIILKVILDQIKFIAKKPI